MGIRAGRGLVTECLGELGIEGLLVGGRAWNPIATADRPNS